MSGGASIYTKPSYSREPNRAAQLVLMEEFIPPERCHIYQAGRPVCDRRKAMDVIKFVAGVDRSD